MSIAPLIRIPDKETVMAGDEKLGNIRDPLKEGEDKAGRPTSGNREESMTESGDDAFGRDGEQRPRESGTTPLGGESKDAGDRTGPGGVEGTE
ncbi:MAG: hypothetical protein ACSLFK_06580 [Gemmatimonadaceae bacterium]